ncbi:DNA glycosylase [Mariannaea sp. PMI_226]|nr:DNA glycosylase [Mariannaea sp. PMI_226]
MSTRSLRKRVAEGKNYGVSAKKRQIRPVSTHNNEGLEELPHNLGSARASTSHTKLEAENSIVSVKDEETRDSKDELKVKHESLGQETVLSRVPSDSDRRSLRPRRLATYASYFESENENGLTEAVKLPSRKRSISTKRTVKKEIDQSDPRLGDKQAPRKSVKKTKQNPYGLTPGITPFPDWTLPSTLDCQEVYERLAKVHGHVKAPDKVPAPSLEVSGCGEVPSVLDALIRTRLSAHTSAANSNAAFKGLVTKFGVVKSGIGEGSVDWNKVRAAPVEDIEGAIKHGGLAKVKSRDIKAILEMVHQENILRRDAFLAEKNTGVTAEVVGAKEKTKGQKDLEILKAEQGLLSLDHIHGMHPDEAMQALVKFPGIGVKTASCVILFCLRQPSFAVDTHVHRMSGWLKWIPPKSSRDQAFSHLEVRVPPNLKYGLHKLFVQHGRICVRCRANTTEGTEGWSDASCPVEDLVERVGKRKVKGA